MLKEAAVLLCEVCVTLKSFQTHETHPSLAVFSRSCRGFKRSGPKICRHGVLHIVIPKHHFVQGGSPQPKFASRRTLFLLSTLDVLKTHELCYAELAVRVLICASAMQAKTDLVDRERKLEVPPAP